MLLLALIAVLVLILFALGALHNLRLQKLPPRHHVAWPALLFLLAVTATWCFYEISALMDTRCIAVGFNPLVLLALPVGCVLSLCALLIAFICKSFPAAVLAPMPILALGLPIYFGYQLSIAGWSHEIGRYSEANRVLIETTDFSLAKFDEVPYKDHERMVALPDFKWSNSIGVNDSRNEVAYGFLVNDIPHVYICPLRNGARGVAWVSDKTRINKDPRVRYEETGHAKWYVWTLSE